MPRRLQALVTVSWVLFIAGAGALAQQPQTYVQQAGSGLAPSVAAYPNLSIASGNVLCSNATVAYAGGQVTTIVNGVNYVYFDCGTSAPKSSASPFSGGQIPLAVVVAQSGSYGTSGLLDVRPWAITRAGPTLPVSDFPPGAGTRSEARAAGPAADPAPDPTYYNVTTTAGTSGYLPYFSGVSYNVENSNVYQSGSNIGIGTISPGYLLDVSGGSARVTNPTGTTQLTVSGMATSGRLGQDSTGLFLSSDTNGAALRFGTNNGSGNEWMRITSAGNVGIGTTSPGAPLTLGNASPVLLDTFGTSSPNSFASLNTNPSYLSVNHPDFFMSRNDTSSSPTCVPGWFAPCDSPMAELEVTNANTGIIASISALDIVAGNFAANDNSGGANSNFTFALGTRWEDAATPNVTIGRAQNVIAVVKGVPTKSAGGGFTRTVAGIEIDVSNQTTEIPFHFSGGGGSGAAGYATVVSGAISTVTVTNGGSGYTSAPTISFVAGTPGSGATFTVSISGGAVTGATVTYGGSGYSGVNSVVLGQDPGYCDAGQTTCGNVLGGMSIVQTYGPNATDAIGIGSSSNVSGAGFLHGLDISGISGDCAICLYKGGPSGGFSPTEAIHVETTGSYGVVVGTGTVADMSSSGVTPGNPTTGILLDAQGTTGTSETQSSNSLVIRAKTSSSTGTDWTLTQSGADNMLDLKGPAVANSVNHSFVVGDSSSRRLELGYGGTSGIAGTTDNQAKIIWGQVGPYAGDLLIGSRGNYATNLIFYTSPGSGVAERVRINSSGSVGIGTTTPALQLQVAKAMGAAVASPSGTSGSITFDASAGNTFYFTLSGNVTSSLNYAAKGELINFIICEPAGGGDSFSWPTNVSFHGAMAISTVASKCSAQTFVMTDSTNAYALTGGTTYTP